MNTSYSGTISQDIFSINSNSSFGLINVSSGMTFKKTGHFILEETSYSKQIPFEEDNLIIEIEVTSASATYMDM